MNLIRWEPLREFDSLLRQFSPGLRRPFFDQEERWMPTANISETDKEYLIKAELPEVKKEDVRITLQDDVITISGERKHEKEQKDESEIRVESYYGTFSRSFALPGNVDTKNIRAESKDGVLRISIPKTEVAAKKPVTIEVK